MQNSDSQKEQAIKEAQEKKNKILAQILTNEAKERLSRVALVKPEKAAQVEDYLIQQAQSRQLVGKVDEKKIISLLESLSSGQKETKIVIQQKRGLFDEDF